MQKKLMSWKTKGMNQDLSVSAFNPEFSFENMNLRLSTNEGNTLMSWVNEKGTKTLSLAIDSEPWSDAANKVPHTIIDGYPIGTAIIEHQLVLFTTSRTSEDTIIPESLDKPDNIYVLTYDAENDLIKGKRLYHGNLGFDVQHPLETLAFFESQYIQKIYWTDGKNQPRIINICAGNDKLEKWNHGGADYAGQDYYFDFIPSFGFKETVNITKNNTAGGTFAPGVIQYCLTYINKYGQQSNVFYQSPLYYLSPSDRGASPEEKVGCSFTITIENADTDFDYVRLYSIQRTSVNGEVIAKLLEDIAIDSAINDTLTYTDSGTTGTSIDSTELLYVGGAEVVAGTLADKDNTLFLGNIEQKNIIVSDIQDYFDDIRDEEHEAGYWPAFKYDGDGESVKTLQADTSNGFYAHTQQLDRSQREITTFKGGDYYRFGFQLQKRTGEWTEPIFIDDVQNDKYPHTGVYSDVIKLAYASCKIDIKDIKAHLGENLDFSVFKRIRPMVVYPDLSDRYVVCQGVINPTVFNYEDRYFNSPFAQPSWFFRPYMFNEQEADTFIPEYTTCTIGQASSTKPVLPEGQTQTFNPAIDISLFVPKYVMVEPIQVGYLLTVLSNKTLHYTINGNSYDETFDYAVVLGGNAFYPTVAFFKDVQSQWANVILHTEGMPDSACLYSDKTWLLYSGLGNDSGLAYYQKINDEAPEYCLDFYTKTTVNDVNTYTPFYITFRDTQVIDFERRKSLGSPLRFSHYESLFTRSECGPIAGISLPERIEIQGAVNSVPSPVEGDLPSTVLAKNNTQFFIDQSIVTLNSPDLEFDQALQASGTDGMMLRIIGAIPITANNSWHDIQTEGIMGVNPSLRPGSGEHNWTSSYKNIDKYAGNRLVSKFLWNDVIWYSNEGVAMFGPITDFLISPWQTSSYLNNNGSATLKFKRESNLLYSLGTEYLTNDAFVRFEKISTKLHLTENAEVMNIKLPKQAAESTDINYYGNIDKVLYNADGFGPLFKPVDKYIPEGFEGSMVYRTLSMKYKSTTHAIIAVNEDSEHQPSPAIPVMPEASTSEKNVGTFKVEEGTAYWGDTVHFSQKAIDVSGLFVEPFDDDEGIHHDFNLLWLGELYKEPVNRFGGTGRSAIRSNNWLIGGEAVNLPKEEDESQEVTLNWTDGDTYYQRYDCLKTYPYTYEDPNQLVEILSFMCETHVNIDGRYDRNRGQVDNTLMSPQNFNQYNAAYSQRNNYFTYRKLDTENSRLYYPNQVYYSKTKTSGADVDLYTNVTLASIHELDGSKGKVNALRKWNNQLLAFQDSGISQIMFNENTLLSTERGVPVEIANSGKIQGNHYISDTIGCSNKWSIVSTPSGIYFMDSNDKSIYRFSGQLQNISATQGFNTWCKTHIPNSSLLWNPKDFDNIVGYYDRLNQDILFINKEHALAYSEKLGCFTSFYSYNGIPYFCNLDDMGLWLNHSTYPKEEEDEEHEPHLINCVKTNVWQHQGGEYCKFFNEYQKYWMTLVGNQEPQMDKIFTNLEFRASVEGDGELDSETGKFTPALPFDSLETWNEYQHGFTTLENKSGHSSFVHGTDSSSLKRKFRIWSNDIPRNNYKLLSVPDREDYETEEEYNEALEVYNTWNQGEIEKCISRKIRKPLDRMRNPWLYLKLTKQDSTNKRTEVHDLVMTYYS